MTDQEAAVAVLALFLVFFAINIVFCGLVAAWASSKGRSGTKAFFLGLFFTPVVSFLVVALLKNKTTYDIPQDLGVYYTTNHDGQYRQGHLHQGPEWPLTDPNPKH